MQNVKLSPAAMVILVAGVVMLIGSFLDFYEIDFDLPDIEIEGLDIPAEEGFSAWSGDLFFPVTIIPVLCGVLMSLHVGLTAFAGTRFPDRIAGFGWNQIHLLLGFQAAIMMLAFLLQDIGIADRGIGFWLMLIAAIALVVGALMRTREAAPAT
jgi:hypothetical protein